MQALWPHPPHSHMHPPTPPLTAHPFGRHYRPRLERLLCLPLTRLCWRRRHFRLSHTNGLLIGAEDLPGVSPYTLRTAAHSYTSGTRRYSPSIRSTSLCLTRATSLTSIDMSPLALKVLSPGTYPWTSLTVPKSGGLLTGCFSLRSQDCDSFLYFNNAPHTYASRQYEDRELSAFLTRGGCGR